MVLTTAGFGYILSVRGGQRLRGKLCSSPVDDDRSGDAACPVGSKNGPSLQHIFDVSSTNMMQGRAIFGSYRPDPVAGPVIVDRGGAGLSKKPTHGPVSVR